MLIKISTLENLYKQGETREIYMALKDYLEKGRLPYAKKAAELLGRELEKNELLILISWARYYYRFDDMFEAVKMLPEEDRETEFLKTIIKFIQPFNPNTKLAKKIARELEEPLKTSIEKLLAHM